jgi:hypothetical protein
MSLIRPRNRLRTISSIRSRDVLPEFVSLELQDELQPGRDHRDVAQLLQERSEFADAFAIASKLVSARSRASCAFRTSRSNCLASQIIIFERGGETGNPLHELRPVIEPSFSQLHPVSHLEGDREFADSPLEEGYCRQQRHHRYAREGVPSQPVGSDWRLSAYCCPKLVEQDHRQKAGGQAPTRPGGVERRPLRGHRQLSSPPACGSAPGWVIEWDDEICSRPLCWLSVPPRDPCAPSRDVHR